MKNLSTAFLLVTTFLVNPPHPTWAIKGEDEGSSTSPRPKVMDPALAKKKEDLLHVSLKVLETDPYQLETYLDLTSLGQNFLNDPEEKKQEMGHKALETVSTLISHEAAPHQLQLRVGGELARIFASVEPVKDYDKSLYHSSALVLAAKPYHLASLFTTLRTIAEAEDSTLEHKTQAYELLLTYANRFRPDLLITFYPSYFQLLKANARLVGDKSEEIFRILKRYDDQAEKNPSYANYMGLGSLYEGLYGLEGPGAALTRQAYLNAANYYKEYTREERDVLEIITQNRHEFFHDPFEFFLFIKKAFKRTSKSSWRSEQNFTEWLKSTAETDTSEECKIIQYFHAKNQAEANRFLGANAEPVEGFTFEAETLGAFLTEGVYIASLPKRMQVEKSRDALQKEIALFDQNIAEAEVMDAEDVSFGPIIFNYDRAEYQPLFTYGSIEEAKEALIERFEERDELDAQQGLYEDLSEERKAWLDALDVESAYELTRVYHLLFHNDEFLSPPLLKDYEFILKSLAERKHVQSLKDLKALYEKFIYDPVNKVEVRRMTSSLIHLLEDERINPETRDQRFSKGLSKLFHNVKNLKLYWY